MDDVHSKQVCHFLTEQQIELEKSIIQICQMEA